MAGNEEYDDLVAKKHISDVSLGELLPLLDTNSQNNLASKINPTSVFNGILENAYDSEGIKYKSGLGGNITTILSGDKLKISRAQYIATTSFRKTYGMFSDKAISSYINAMEQVLEENNSKAFYRDIVTLQIQIRQVIIHHKYLI